MRKLGLIAIMFVLFMGVVGCTTTAGPVVTNVYSDANGNLIIEKNKVVYNKFTGLLSMGDEPTTTELKIKSDKDDE